MLLLRIMGCGRSKYNSQKNNPDENAEDENNGKKTKVSSKQEKNKVAYKKENHLVKTPKSLKSPSKSQKKNAGTTKKTNNSSPSAHKKTLSTSNGTATKDYLCVNQGQSRLEVQGPKSAFKGKQLPVDGHEMKITHSQVEFFKMLDERIEQGPPGSGGCYTAHEELEKYKIHETLEELEIEDDIIH